MLTTRQPTPRSSDIERSAFNAAFHELGLRWHWDGATYETLATTPCERQRVQHYLETHQSHLLRAYDADFLTDAILEAKQRRQHTLGQCAPQVTAVFDCSDAHQGQVGF